MSGRGDNMKTIEEQFREFHGNHPEVYDELVKVLRRWCLRTPGKSWSIWGAYQVVRWQRSIEGLDAEPFKLSNNYTGFYARLIRLRVPMLRNVISCSNGRHVSQFDPSTVQG